MEADSPARVRWLIFGDSWATGDMVDTWPEIIASKYGGRALNFAAPHSSSIALLEQLDEVTAFLAASDASLNEDATAIIHAGGNDLYFSSPTGQVSVAAVGFLLRCLGRAADASACISLSPPVQAFARNLHVLLRGLTKVGVHRFVVAGVPLTARMPFIPTAVGRLGVPGALHFCSSVMRASNAAMMTGIETAFNSLERSVFNELQLCVLVDEARAIESIVDHACSVDSNHRYWHDGSHPSQLLHDALALEVTRQMHESLTADSPRATEQTFEATRSDVKAQMLRYRTPSTQMALDAITGPHLHLTQLTNHEPVPPSRD